MGDTPINLRSPEQKSQVLFSRRVHDKKEWADLFEFTATQEEFKDAVAANSSPIYRTTAYTCPSCKGKVYRLKKMEQSLLDRINAKIVMHKDTN